MITNNCDMNSEFVSMSFDTYQLNLADCSPTCASKFFQWHLPNHSNAAPQAESEPHRQNECVHFDSCPKDLQQLGMNICREKRKIYNLMPDFIEGVNLQGSENVDQNTSLQQKCGAKIKETNRLNSTTPVDETTQLQANSQEILPETIVPLPNCTQSLSALSE